MSNQKGTLPTGAALLDTTDPPLAEGKTDSADRNVVSASTLQRSETTRPFVLEDPQEGDVLIHRSDHRAATTQFAAFPTSTASKRRSDSKSRSFGKGIAPKISGDSLADGSGTELESMTTLSYKKVVIISDDKGNVWTEEELQERIDELTFFLKHHPTEWKRSIQQHQTDVQAEAEAELEAMTEKCNATREKGNAKLTEAQALMEAARRLKEAGNSLIQDATRDLEHATMSYETKLVDIRKKAEAKLSQCSKATMKKQSKKEMLQSGLQKLQNKDDVSCLTFGHGASMAIPWEQNRESNDRSSAFATKPTCLQQLPASANHCSSTSTISHTDIMPRSVHPEKASRMDSISEKAIPEAETMTMKPSVESSQPTSTVPGNVIDLSSDTDTEKTEKFSKATLKSSEEVISPRTEKPPGA